MGSCQQSEVIEVNTHKNPSLNDFGEPQVNQLYEEQKKRISRYARMGWR